MEVVSSMRLGKSKVLSYVNCPQYFKWNYISEIPIPENKYAKRGKDIHKIVQDFFDRFDTSKWVNMTPTKLRETLYDIIKCYHSYEKYKEWLNNFIELEVMRFSYLMGTYKEEGIKYYKPKYRELDIEIFKPLHLKGIIDRVDYSPEQGYRIYDYKTGYVSKPKMKEEMFALSIYAYLLKAKYNIMPTKVGIIGLKNRTILEEDITTNHINSALKIVKKVFKKMEAEEFDYNKDANCFFCPDNYKQMCKKIKEKENRKRAYEGIR